MSNGLGIEGTHHTMMDIALKDGFKSLRERRAWFDKAYDLSSPKKFYVYRWGWK